MVRRRICSQLTNSSDIPVKLYLRAELAKQKKYSSKKLEQLQKLLTEYAVIEIRENDKVLYQGSVDGNLTRQGWSMKNDISLGHFAAGSGKSLIVQLSLSEDMDNTYEEMLGKVKWVFTAAGGAFGPEKENESSGASDTVEDDAAQNNRNNGYIGTSDEKHEGNERNQGVGAEEKIYASVAASPKTGDPTQAAVKWFILFAALTVMVLTFRKLYGKGKNR